MELDDGRSFRTSSRFIDDVVYGYQTIESTVRMAVDFVIKLADIGPTLPDPDTLSAPVLSVRYVESLEEAMALREDETGFVAMPDSLYREISDRVGRQDRHHPLHLIRFGDET